MNTYVEQKPSIYRSIRNLFIIGLVGLLLSASGVIWLLVESAQQSALRAQQISLLTAEAALYSGSWSNKHDPNFSISKIVINNNGLDNNNVLNITVHVFGNCSRYSYISCDMGTYAQQFIGGPITIITIYDSSLVMTSSHTNSIQLKVEVYNTVAFFDKT